MRWSEFRQVKSRLFRALEVDVKSALDASSGRVRLGVDLDIFGVFDEDFLGQSPDRPHR